MGSVFCFVLFVCLFVLLFFFIFFFCVADFALWTLTGPRTDDTFFVVSRTV